MPSLKPNLFKSFEEKGEWWIPNYPEKKVVGTVSYSSEEGITLELFGSFLGPGHFRQRRRFDPRIILGLTNNGEQITLLENMQTHAGQSSRGGTGTVKYISNYLFIGGHFNSPNEMQFHSCSFHYTSLEAWIGKHPFETEFINEEDKFIGETATYKNIEGFKVKVPTLNATISSWHGLGGSYGSRKFVWKHNVGLSVDPDEPRDFKWFRKVQFALRNLLSLLIGYPVYLKRVNFIIEKPGEKDIEEGRDRRSIVSVYFSQRTQYPRKRKYRMEMLIRFDDIEENIASILEAWFSKAEKLEDVYQLFIGSMYNRKMYTHLHFLTLMQALETYHRSTREGQYISKEEYEKVFAALIIAIPADTERSLKASLKGRLKYGNEYSLRKRIKLLLDELADECRMLITKEPERFLSSIINTRNYLTHYDSSLKPNVLEEVDLYNASLSLRILITILLLKELGLEEQKIVELLSRNDPVTRRALQIVEYDEDMPTDEAHQLTN